MKHVEILREDSEQCDKVKIINRYMHREYFFDSERKNKISVEYYLSKRSKELLKVLIDDDDFKREVK